MTARKEFSPVRHPFLYTVELPDGTVVTKTKMARVVKAKKPVWITLTAEHVERSIRLKGVGNTATCSAAICTYAHKAAFPHPVVGYTDWTYSRAYVVSKLDDKGLPDECYCYEHDDEIARLNDSKDGQRQLLVRLRKSGSITILLRPYRQRSEEGRSGRNRRGSGVRTNRTGANLRVTASLKTGALAPLPEPVRPSVPPRGPAEERPAL
jgi:hypothetical protein